MFNEEMLQTKRIESSLGHHNKMAHKTASKLHSTRFIIRIPLTNAKFLPWYGQYRSTIK